MEDSLPGRRESARDFARIAASLFLPLAAGVWLLGRLDLEQTTATLHTRRMFAYFLPFLADARPSALAVALAVAAAALALFLAAPARARKPLLCVFASFYIARFTSPAFALAHLSLAAALFWALRRHAALLPRLLPAAAAVVLCVLAAGPNSLASRLALNLLFLSVVKAISLCVDAAADDEPPAFVDIFLHLTGGVPCNFMGPKYTFAGFRRCYLARPYRELASRGVVQIYFGLLKVAAAALLELSLPSAAGHCSWKLWLLVAAIWTRDLLRLVGIYDALQGANRLFGFDLQNQFDRPWLAQSPLDFWRRFGTNNRDYLLKYVYFPIHRLGGGIFVALPAVFLASAAFNLLIYVALGHALRRGDDAVSVAGLWLFHFTAFTAACLLEAHARRSPEAAVAARFTGGPSRAARIAATWVLIVALQAPMPYVLDLARRGPSEGLARRLAGLYGRLSGLSCLTTPPLLR